MDTVDGTLWLRNAWYQAGWAGDVAVGRPLLRTILGEPILIIRSNNGALAALFDRCPHRFAPLSAGRFEDSVVTCGYHGLAFNSSGACVRNPHGPVAASMRVRSYRVVEKHTVVWIWMGDPAAASVNRIPDLAFIDETPESARIVSYMPTRCNYQLLTDNIMDLSHADYLHPDTLGGMMTASKTQMSEKGETITVSWTASSCDAPPAFQSAVPPPGKADISIDVTWTAPAVMVLRATATPAGVPRSEDDESLTLHNMTPETATSSHYFICSTRKFLAADAKFNEFLRETLTRAFQCEDKPMLEKQQARMGDEEFWSLKPLLLRVDAAAVRVRHQLKRLIVEEAQLPGVPL